MKFVDYKTDLFRVEFVPTEREACRLMRHNNIISNATYVAVPWSVIINKKMNVKPPSVKNGWTVCQHICFHRLIPLFKSIGITTLFTPHAEGDRDGLEILPFPHYAINTMFPTKKDLTYSFIGADTHHTRRVIFGLPKKEDVVIGRTPRWHFERDRKEWEEAANTYKDILARSRYSLCPRGTGPSTIRLWESLRAGSVPVIISDAIRLPSWYNWSRCTLKIKEQDVQQVDKIIRNDAREDLSSKCIEAYEQFSGDNFISCISKQAEAKP